MPRERVTEIKTIDIDRTCHDNPAYLTWVDSTGGRNYWLFFKTRGEGKEVQAGQVFSKFIPDLATARSNSEYLSKESAVRWIVGADNVPTNKMRGLESLIEAVKVEILMNPDEWESDGPLWQTVKILPGSFKTVEAGSERHSITMTLQFSDRYIQTQ